MDTLLADIRFALRQMRRAPGVTAVAVILLGLGVGTNAALFTVLHSLRGRMAPGVTGKGLVEIADLEIRRGRTRDALTTLGEYLQYREQETTFAGVAAWSLRGVSIDAGGGAERGTAHLVTANYFDLLGVRMTLGGGLPALDDRVPAAPPIAIVSDGFWRNRLGGALDVIGRTISVDGTRLTVVGVTRERFNGARYNESPVALWLPIGLREQFPPSPGSPFGDSLYVQMIGKLQPGVTVAQARAVAHSVAERTADRGGDSVRVAVRVEPLTAARSSSDSARFDVQAAFAGLGIFILLITCTNVSNLLIGRAVARRHEMGVRLSLGASRRRIIRQLLTESALLALLGTTAAMLLFYWSLGVIAPAMFAVLPDLRPDWTTLIVSAGLAVGAGVIFGLAPALAASRAGVGEALKSGAATPGARRSRLQGGFVIAQVAITVPALAAGAALVAVMVREVVGSAGYEESERIGTLSLGFDVQRYSPSVVTSLTSEAERRLAALPGVVGIARSRYSLPGADDVVPGSSVTGAGGSRGFRLPPDEGGVSRELSFDRQYMQVGHRFFDVLGLPIRRGRPIDSSDVAGSPAVVVVSEDFANLAWPGEDALGKRLVRGSGIDTTFTVVGVAAPIRDRRGDPAPVAYVSIYQRPDTVVDFVIGTIAPIPSRRAGSAFIIRSSTSLSALAGVRVAQTPERGERVSTSPIEGVVRSIDPEIRVSARSFAATREIVFRNVAPIAAGALAIGAVLLFLSGIGLYAIVASGVAQRVREIGIRLALGARGGQVVRMFVRRGASLGAIGLAFGLPPAIAATAILPDVGGLNAANSVALAVMGTVVIAAAAVAAWLPARRAARVDPVQALRAE